MEFKTRFSVRRNVVQTAVLGAAVIGAFTSITANAQQTIRIGELNSYKSQPAFLEPYKKGWELAVAEINERGGINGKKFA
jgi:branched-chain amino acid transport system substrate-binding protein